MRIGLAPRRSLSPGPRDLPQGCPAVPSQVVAPATARPQPKPWVCTCPVAKPSPAAAPIPLPAPEPRREKPWSYRSMMSAMVQANMRSPSGICRATGKRNSHGVRRGWKGRLEVGTS